jgi:hypothetical protein
MGQMTIFYVLGGLLILTLMLASIAQRYHAYVEERRRQVEKILRRVAELEELITRMTGLPVPLEAERLLHEEILARLEVVKGIHHRHQGIDHRIAQAKSTLASLAPRESATNLDDNQMEILVRGLAELRWMVQERRFIAPLSEPLRASLLELLIMRRAEWLYRYHRRGIEHMLREDKLHQALWHCNQLHSFLLNEGPDNEQAQAWMREAEERRRQIEAEINGQSKSPSTG